MYVFVCVAFQRKAGGQTVRQADRKEIKHVPAACVCTLVQTRVREREQGRETGQTGQTDR